MLSIFYIVKFIVSEAARKYIADYCERNKIAPVKLEQEAGIKRFAIYSFLTGRVADLKLSTAIQIADQLSVSLDELVGRDGFLKKFVKRNAHSLPISKQLFYSITDFIFSHMEREKLQKYNLKELMYSTSEIYEYCINNKFSTVDKAFAEWFCKNQMHLIR